MNNHWIPWSDRNEEFAPILGLHKHHLFFPTRIEAFLKSDCDLVILMRLDSDRGPIFGKINDFPTRDVPEKIQWMLHPKMNKKFTYLDRHGDHVDMRKSAELQEGEPKTVYFRGFRNTQTGEAYLTYWTFYLENFVPRSLDDMEIAETLEKRPDIWWSHEGDWEAISVRFANYEDSHPTEVIFTQHDTEESIQWSEMEKESGRILAIPAIGSHAMFNKPLKKKRFLFLAEVASPDILCFPGNRGGPVSESYELEEFDPPDKHLWLHFKGRWGQSSGEFSKAPTGPLMKRRKHFELLADRQN